MFENVFFGKVAFLEVKEFPLSEFVYRSLAKLKNDVIDKKGILAERTP